MWNNNNPDAVETDEPRLLTPALGITWPKKPICIKTGCWFTYDGLTFYRADLHWHHLSLYVRHNPKGADVIPTKRDWVISLHKSETYEKFYDMAIFTPESVALNAAAISGIKRLMTYAFWR